MMSNEKGLTLLEMLVAGAIASVVILAISTFFGAMARMNQEIGTAAYVERQGALALDEMRRRVNTAAFLTVGTGATTCPATPSSPFNCRCNGSGSLGVWVPVDSSLTHFNVYCFYQSGTQLLQDLTPYGGSIGTMDLLAGSLAALTAQQNGDGTPTFNANLWASAGGTPVTCGSTAAPCTVTVTFELGSCMRQSSASEDCNFMRFTSDLTRKN